MKTRLASIQVVYTPSSGKPSPFALISAPSACDRFLGLTLVTIIAKLTTSKQKQPESFMSSGFVGFPTDLTQGQVPAPFTTLSVFGGGDSLTPSSTSSFQTGTSQATSTALPSGPPLTIASPYVNLHSLPELSILIRPHSRNYFELCSTANFIIGGGTCELYAINCLSGY